MMQAGFVQQDQAITLYGYMLESEKLVACFNLLLGYGNVYSADALDDLRTGKLEYRDRNGARPHDDAKRASARAVAALLRGVADGLEGAVTRGGVAVARQAHTLDVAGSNPAPAN